MNLKEEVEQRKAEAREALDRHRGVVFPRYQTAINEYLRKFSTGFRIAEVAPVDPRGTPSSTYQIEINSCLVPLNHANTGEPTPTFKSTLSAGDRNALALAFFFSSLEQEPDLSSVVVVIDDPVSSLDDGRTLTTAQEIRALSQRAQQVILLSHSKPVLCMVWQHADQSNCSAISVVRGPNGSNIDAWNVNVEAITEYDRQHELLRCYSLGSERDFRKVAQSLRPVLEGFLRVVCSEHFQPGAQLGQFIARARTCGIAGQPIMLDTAINELDALREYTNRFHHETNQAWHAQMNNINETELNGFVRRVLDFTTIRAT
jgi:wobble nucleotide-excising tRNase